MIPRWIKTRTQFHGELWPLFEIPRWIMNPNQDSRLNCYPGQAFTRVIIQHWIFTQVILTWNSDPSLQMYLTPMNRDEVSTSLFMNNLGNCSQMKMIFFCKNASSTKKHTFTFPVTGNWKIPENEGSAKFRINSLYWACVANFIIKALKSNRSLTFDYRLHKWSLFDMFCELFIFCKKVWKLSKKKTTETHILILPHNDPNIIIWNLWKFHVIILHMKDIIWIFISKQNISTEGCSKIKRSVDMTSSGKNGLNIRKVSH